MPEPEYNLESPKNKYRMWVDQIAKEIAAEFKRRAGRNK
jgi:hypothetical protein